MFQLQNERNFQILDFRSEATVHFFVFFLLASENRKAKGFVIQEENALNGAPAINPDNRGVCRRLFQEATWHARVATLVDFNEAARSIFRRQEVAAPGPRIGIVGAESR